MPGRLNGRRIAFLCTKGVEQVELEKPLEAVRDEGAIAEIISLKHGTFTAFQHLEAGDEFEADHAVADVAAGDYDGLVLPGGVANPDFLRQDRDAVRFVRDFFEHGKPVAAICHGPWMLVEADVLRGRTVTSYPSLRTDIRNAGGEWVDEEVVVDAGLVTSRNPGDLPAFCDKLVEELCEGRHRAQARSAAGTAA